MTVSSFSRLFAYDRWATERTIAELRRSPHPDEPALRLIAHVLAAEQIWLARLEEADASGLEVWPSLTLDQCAVLADELTPRFREFVEGLGEAQLREPVSYRNTRGRVFRTAVGDILTHVANHSTHHRAQISSSLRQRGIEPPALDYITYVRESSH